MALQVRLKRSDRVYRPGELVQGVVVCTSDPGSPMAHSGIKMKVSDSKDIIRLTLVSQGQQIGQVEIPIHLIMFKSKFQKWYPLKSGSEDTLNQIKIVSIFEPDHAQLDNFQVLNF